jgi:hypothetical protein
MHRFFVTKPPPTAYGEAQLSEANQQIQTDPEQLRAIGKITNVLRAIIIRLNNMSDTVLSGKPFQLFEMHSDIALLIGLRAHCWVMLEMSGHSPTVIFEDRDLAHLRGKSAAELESAASALHCKFENPTALTLLTRAVGIDAERHTRGRKGSAYFIGVVGSCTLVLGHQLDQPTAFIRLTAHAMRCGPREFRVKLGTTVLLGTFFTMCTSTSAREHLRP